MTTIIVTLGGSSVTNDVKEIQIWRKASEGIGRFQLLLDNKDGQYTDSIPGDAAVSITVDSALLFAGYIDVAKEIITETEIEKFHREMITTGRCVGQDLINRFYTKIYPNMRADDIIADVLANGGGEITYTSPHTAPYIYYDTKSNHYIDTLREIAEAVNYDFYVENDKSLKFFSVGTLPSGIALKSTPGALDNNILKTIEYVNKSLLEIRNYIKVFGSILDDHWTEMNASDWSGYPGNTVTDYTDTSPTTVQKGAAAIKSLRNEAVEAGLKLSFPKFNYLELDFRKVENEFLKFRWYPYKSNVGDLYKPWIYLWDTQEPQNIICWHYNMAAGVDRQPRNTWLEYVIPIDHNYQIQASETNEKWYYIQGSNFNWRVVDIGIYDRSYLNGIQPDYILLDWLRAPVQTFGLAQDATSINLYKKRMLSIVKAEVTCQKLLQAYADQVLARRKDLKTRMFLVAKGSIGLISGAWKWIPGYTVTVNGPSYIWRIAEVHHIISRNAMLGHDHVVEVQLISKDEPVDTLSWSYTVKGEIGIIRALRDRLRYEEQQKIVSG